MTLLLRSLVALASFAVTALAAWLFTTFALPDGWSVFDTVRLALSSICMFWLTWGTATAVVGLFGRHVEYEFDDEIPDVRTAILVPIYNEDPPSTFARVAAMSGGLTALDLHQRFDIYLLSDTTSLDVAARETVWFERLLRETIGREHLFYRRRSANKGRKAGNIEEFIRRSGGAYKYAIVLDADSLVEPLTMLRMVQRMEASPRLGLLQTLPTIVHARSLFGRAMQFSAAYYSEIFALGAAQLQGGEGPFWGHNAIFRVQAFAQSCGLPVLAGKPPFGGHILSHDYVEAALLARGGWEVRLEPGLGGSYEEGPENALDFAKRDRRWCQGNLQHHRVLMAPGLRLWNRITLLQGIMAYMLPPMYLALLCVSLAASALPARLRDTPEPWAAWSLIALVAALLLGPKLLILVRGIFDGRNRRLGGTLKVAASVVTEIMFSTLLAPITLLYQARAVLQVFGGIDGGWPASNRDDGYLSLRDAWAASFWISMLGGVALASVMAFAPPLTGWSLAVILPTMIAPLTIAFTSRSVAHWRPFWQTAEERQPSPVMAEWRRIRESWIGGSGGSAPDRDAPMGGAADARS